jgi:hypothetical protein
MNNQTDTTNPADLLIKSGRYYYPKTWDGQANTDAAPVHRHIIWGKPRFVTWVHIHVLPTPEKCWYEFTDGKTADPTVSGKPYCYKMKDIVEQLTNDEAFDYAIALRNEADIEADIEAATDDAEWTVEMAQHFLSKSGLPTRRTLNRTAGQYWAEAGSVLGHLAPQLEFVKNMANESIPAGTKESIQYFTRERNAWTALAIDKEPKAPKAGSALWLRESAALSVAKDSKETPCPEVGVKAVVECVTALAAMTADPAHFSEGPVTSGAVYIRLATKHGIDKGSAHAISLIDGAVEAGLIEIQRAEWADGVRTTDTILTLAPTETDEVAQATRRAEVKAKCDKLVEKIGKTCPDGHKELEELDQLHEDADAKANGDIEWDCFQWGRVVNAIEKLIAGIGEANAQAAYDQAEGDGPSLDICLGDSEQNVLDTVATSTQEYIASAAFLKEAERLRKSKASDRMKAQQVRDRKLLKPSGGA